jgi:hypothetical protein
VRAACQRAREISEEREASRSAAQERDPDQARLKGPPEVDALREQLRQPDLTGAFGRAWDISGAKSRPEQEAGLRAWLLHRPGAHPFWSWWLVSVVHLREIPGAPPARKQFPEADHEFRIVTINPEACPHVVEQFGGLTDEQAMEIGDWVIRHIVFDGVWPDQDFRRYWHEAIGGMVQAFGGTEQEAGDDGG